MYSKKILVNVKEAIVVVPIDDVKFITTNYGLSFIVLKSNKEYVSSKSLKNLISDLEESKFYKCHNSYAVNLNYIKRYHKNGFVELYENTMLPVSRRRKDKLLKYLSEL